MGKTNSNTETTTTNEDQVKVVTLAQGNTSKMIRYLKSLGHDTKTIYKMINSFGVTTKEGGEIRYQHVRNVLHTIVKN